MRVARAPLLLSVFFLVPWFSTPTNAGNVRWNMGDSLVTVCPAGDSVVAGHPSVLRFAVTYTNASGTAKVGVPPDSIYATLKRSGNAAVVLWDATAASDNYDWKVSADDSTDANGLARIRVVGFAGC